MFNISSNFWFHAVCVGVLNKDRSEEKVGQLHLICPIDKNVIIWPATMSMSLRANSMLVWPDIPEDIALKLLYWTRVVPAKVKLTCYYFTEI